MKPFNRRNFLKVSGLSVLPSILSFEGHAEVTNQANANLPKIKFYGDGEMFEPGEYINELQKANTASEIIKDRYGAGGVVEALENKFVELTGKEKAIFMPSGTMANQFAIAELSGENSKVFVQDMSHVYRDEADAAQSVFHKRLMPLAMGGSYFTAEELNAAIETLTSKEVFKTGIGAVSIENPVRRTDGRVVPLPEIISISRYCKQNNIRLHLDGARIHIASAWTGVSVKEYASYFDTVYISLYKYFGAAAGAMLCGPATVIDKMSHMIKVHGGSMYGNWANAAMALYRMEGFDNRIKNTISRMQEVVTGVNKIKGVKISPLEGGTNIYAFELAKEIDGVKMQKTLYQEYNMVMARPDETNRALITFNETILYQPADFVISAIKKACS